MRTRALLSAAVLFCAASLATACSCGYEPRALDGASLDGSLRDGESERFDARPTPRDSTVPQVDAGSCTDMAALVRDFDITHSDFEDENPGLTLGLVRGTLDADRKPVYAHGGVRTANIENETSFAQWYRDVEGVNRRFDILLPLTEESEGRFVYDDDSFFPVDDRGFGMSGIGLDDLEHNFHFTTEIHASFVYEGGESFTFRGDDDLWLFIDDRMVIDLGGTHGPEERTVDLDVLELTVGERYPMDIFHAERHTHGSNFRLETTIRCFMEPDLI